MLVYWEICEQVKVKLEQVKAQLKQARIFNLSHPPITFEMQKYYQKEPKFNGFYSRNNLPTIKDGTYIINLDAYYSIGTHWIAWYVYTNNAVYFDRYRVGQILKKLKSS